MELLKLNNIYEDNPPYLGKESTKHEIQEQKLFLCHVSKPVLLSLARSQNIYSLLNNN